MSKLVNDLIRDGYLKNDVIIDSFEYVKRIEFLPEELEQDAEADVALPIGFGQTISQPRVVAFMLELLEPQRGQKILDVGSGSGWTTALLASIVGSDGKVIAIDVVESLTQFGKKNNNKFGFVENGIVEFYTANGRQGFPLQAPYDRILVSASVANEVPQALKDQLKVGGKMVIPYRDSIVYFEKKGRDDFDEEWFPGFSFVPFVDN